MEYFDVHPALFCLIASALLAQDTKSVLLAIPTHCSTCIHTTSRQHRLKLSCIPHNVSLTFNMYLTYRCAALQQKEAQPNYVLGRKMMLSMFYIQQCSCIYVVRYCNFSQVNKITVLCYYSTERPSVLIGNHYRKEIISQKPQ